jgi:hypothetical protein
MANAGTGNGIRTRRAVASVEYVLVLAVMLPLIALILWIGPRIMNLVYEIMHVMVNWPFL